MFCGSFCLGPTSFSGIFVESKREGLLSLFPNCGPPFKERLGWAPHWSHLQAGRDLLVKQDFGLMKLWWLDVLFHFLFAVLNGFE